MAKQIKSIIFIGAALLLVIGLAVAILLALQYESPAQTAIRDAQNFLARQALDPTSIQWRDIKFYPNKGGHPAVCGSLNAKNAFGAYVGYKPFVVEVDLSDGIGTSATELLDEATGGDGDSIKIWLSPGDNDGDRSYIGSIQGDGVSDDTFSAIQDMDCGLGGTPRDVIAASYYGPVIDAADVYVSTALVDKNPDQTTFAVTAHFGSRVGNTIAICGKAVILNKHSYHMIQQGRYIATTKLTDGKMTTTDFHITFEPRTDEAQFKRLFKSSCKN